ncbi:hypothetical protein [Ralstonia solanacearum]|uniref:hypothetical protein n=1 Tax=Ralstonia solanacearum TaxID=305 RepID=UPI001FFA4E52
MTEQIIDGANPTASNADTQVGGGTGTTRPYSGPAALIGWCSVAAGVAISWSGLFQERGKQGFEIALVALTLGGPSAFVAGIVTLVGRRWIQGALLIVAGMGLVGIAVLLIIAVGSVPYFHG